MPFRQAEIYGIFQNYRKVEVSNKSPTISHVHLADKCQKEGDNMLKIVNYAVTAF